jgi:hypothetical protein
VELRPRATTTRTPTRSSRAADAPPPSRRSRRRGTARPRTSTA